MKQVLVLLFLLACSRCTTHAQKAPYFPKELKVKVTGYRGEPAVNTWVIVEAVYLNRLGLKESYDELYRVKTNDSGMATIIRGAGYKRTGNYSTVAKLLKDGERMIIQLIRLENENREIADLGKIYPVNDNIDYNPKKIEDAPREMTVEEPPPFINEQMLSNPDELPDTTKRAAAKNANPFAAEYRNWKLVEYVDKEKGDPPVLDTFKEGKYEKVLSGLKINSGKPGYWVVNNKEMNFAGHTLYLKWKAETNGHVHEMSGKLYLKKPDTREFYLNWRDLFLVRINWFGTSEWAITYTNREWLYTRIVFNQDNCTAYTATGNYDSQGGKILLEKKNNLSGTTGYFGFRMDDLSGSRDSWVILGEVKLKK